MPLRRDNKSTPRPCNNLLHNRLQPAIRLRSIQSYGTAPGLQHSQHSHGSPFRLGEQEGDARFWGDAVLLDDQFPGNLGGYGVQFRVGEIAVPGAYGWSVRLVFGVEGNLVVDAAAYLVWDGAVPGPDLMEVFGTCCWRRCRTTIFLWV